MTLLSKSLNALTTLTDGVVSTPQHAVAVSHDGVERIGERPDLGTIHGAEQTAEATHCGSRTCKGLQEQAQNCRKLDLIKINISKTFSHLFGSFHVCTILRSILTYFFNLKFDC